MIITKEGQPHRAETPLAPQMGDSRRETLQRAQSMGLIPYLLSDTWETVSGGKTEFHKSLKERGISVTVQTL